MSVDRPTSSRICSSDATSPNACSWTRTLPSAAASTGPARTTRRVDVRGQLAEEVVLRAAADHVHDLDRACRSPPRSARARGGTCRRGSRRSRASGPRARRVRPGRVARRRPGCAPACLPGASSSGRSGSKDGAARAPHARAPTSAAYSGASPSRSHARRHSWTSHRPMTFFRSRVVPPKPRSFVRFAAARLLARRTGASSSTPTSDQVPLEMYAARPGRRAGRRRPRTRCRARPPRRPASLRQTGARRRRGAGGRRAIDRAGRSAGRCRAGRPSRSIRASAHSAGLRIEQLRRARVGRLGPPLRRSASRPSRSGMRRSVAARSMPARRLEREQLVERVDRQELDARRRVQLLGRDPLERLAHELRAAAVAIRERVGERARRPRRADRSRRPTRRCPRFACGRPSRTRRRAPP